VESQRGARVHPSNRVQHQVRARRLHDRIGAVFFPLAYHCFGASFC
jgi:hypothetical protein